MKRLAARACLTVATAALKVAGAALLARLMLGPVETKRRVETKRVEVN